MYISICLINIHYWTVLGALIKIIGFDFLGVLIIYRTFVRSFILIGIIGLKKCHTEGTAYASRNLRRLPFTIFPNAHIRG